jgi:hypothetical protein
MRLRTFLLFGMVLLIATWIRAMELEPPSSAKVQILVLSYPDQIPVPEPSLDVRQVATNRSVSNLFTITEGLCAATALPYGNYMVRIRAGGFRTVEQFLVISQPDISFRVFLSPALFVDSAPNIIRGSIRPTSSQNGKLWVKLLPLVASQRAFEVSVQNGTFQVSGLDEGEYILVVMKGTESVYMEQVKAMPLVTVDIQLPSGQR